MTRFDRGDEDSDLPPFRPLHPLDVVGPVRPSVSAGCALQPDQLALHPLRAVPVRAQGQAQAGRGTVRSPSNCDGVLTCAETNSTAATCSREPRSRRTTDIASGTGPAAGFAGRVGGPGSPAACADGASASSAVHGAGGCAAPGPDNAPSKRSRPRLCRVKARCGAHRPRASWPDSASVTPTSSTTRCSSRPWRPALLASHRRIHGRPPQSWTSRDSPWRTAVRSHRKYLHRAQGRYIAYGRRAGIAASQATWTTRGSMTAAAVDQRRSRVLLPLPGNPETTTTAPAGYDNRAGMSAGPRRSTSPRGRNADSSCAATEFSVAPDQTELPTTRPLT